MNIQFLKYSVINGTAGSGISLSFNIDGKEYIRVSQLGTNKLLWWKENGRYLDENEVMEIEPIVRDLFRDKINEFALSLINLVPEK